MAERDRSPPSDGAEPASGVAPASMARVAAFLGTLVALTVVASSAVAVALPEVAADLSLDTAGTAWVLAAFSLSFSVTTAIFGRMADVHGLRMPMRVGIVLFVAGSLAAASAWSFPVLIAGRLLQGAGAGAVPVLALGIIAARFAGPARGRAFGGLTAVVSGVSASGPLIGGAIAELIDWRAVLGLPVVALLVAEPVARLAPPGRPSSSSGAGLDVRGAVFVAMTVTGVALLLQAPATAPAPIAIAGFVALAAGGAAMATRHVRVRPRGFLPAVVVTDPVFLRCAGAGLTLLASYLGMLLALPLLLAEGQGWSPLQIGVALLPAAAVGAVASRTVGGLVTRLGRFRLAAGLAAGSSAGLLLAAAAPGTPAVMVAGMGLVVVGFAGGQVALVDGISQFVDESVRGVALGVFNCAFFTGGAVGAAFLGGLAELLSLPVALGGLAVLPAAGAVAVATIRG